MVVSLRKISLATLLFGCVAGSQALAGDYFYQCGPDEGGCRKGKERFCLCIPKDETFSDSTFCLNFDDDMTCSATAASNETCPAMFIFKNQADCLAVLYQSVIMPGCKLVRKEKCEADKSYFCDASGDPLTCQKAE